MKQVFAEEKSIFLATVVKLFDDRQTINGYPSSG